MEKAEKDFGGHSMVARLRRVLVCPPARAGWDDPRMLGRWHDLGFHRMPENARAAGEYRALMDALHAAGCETLNLDEGASLSLDAVYTHDASLVTDEGAILLRMGKASRRPEAQAHRDFYRRADIPVLGEIDPPGTVEAGDVVWLDTVTLLVGRGYRTNAFGIECLRLLVRPIGIEVISAPLPHASGPSHCLHLMSLLSLLDDKTALVDLSWLSVETIELLRDRGYRLAEIEPGERETLACNVLALGAGRLLAFEENQKTNQRLRDLGFDLRTFPGSEIGINGGGGPTCLTRPILRGGDSFQMAKGPDFFNRSTA